MSSDAAVPRSPAAFRHSQILLAGLICFVASMFVRPATAQDLRVVTKVSHRNPSDGRSQLLSRSLTLFHGGKVYDFVEEVGEVVIHEPSRSQFVILSLNGNRMACRVQYAELLQLQKVARSKTIAYMDELSALPGSNHRNAIEALAFQLDPQFTENYDDASGRLRLSSQFMTYDVETAEIERAGVVEQYLNWADWTARLNSVLYPQATATPAPRIRLNEVLRQHQRIPTQVELTTTIEGESRLRAEHSYEWQLKSFDRNHIADYERIRGGNDLRWVDLREYQQILVTSAHRHGR